MRRNDEVEAQRSRWTFYETINIYLVSTGYPAFFQEAHPPFRAKTFGYPIAISCSAVQALVSSSGQVQ